MKTGLRRQLTLGLIATCGCTALSHTVAAASSERSLTITVHVRNYAGVAPDTLAEAEEVATGIFRKAGLETRWADTALNTVKSQVNSSDHPGFTLADIQLGVVPPEMSDRWDLANNVMGLAPGTGPDRRMVYVFEGKVDTFFWKMLGAHESGRMGPPISKAKVLGHAIAHEVGHLLLNSQVHSEYGIMRANWGLTEMTDAAYGMLLFTPQQADVLRTDVRRRNEQQETLEVN